MGKWHVDRVDLLTGAILLAFGAAVCAGSLEYDLGSLRRMGPGYAPLLLGAILCMLSVAILASSFRRAQPAKRRQREAPNKGVLRPLILLPLSILSFAFLLEQAGFAPAVFVAVTMAGLAERRNRLGVILLIAAATVLFTAAVFVYALGIPVRLVAF